MYALIHDPNISGHLSMEVESPEEMRDLLARWTGFWWTPDNSDVTGAVLLSEPCAHMFKSRESAEDDGDGLIVAVVTEDEIEVFWHECNHRDCVHPDYRDGHCAYMSCPNYVNKCSEHMIAGGV